MTAARRCRTPEFVGPDRAGPRSEVRSDRYVAREEPEEPAPSPFLVGLGGSCRPSGGRTAGFSLRGPNPPPGTLSSGLGGLSREVGQTCFSQAVSVHRIIV